MPVRTKSVLPEQPSSQEQRSTLAPLLPNDRVEYDEPVGVHGDNSSNEDLPDGPNQTQDYTDEAIELEDIGVAAHVERCANETEEVESSM
jgi:hypothetical protein